MRRRFIKTTSSKLSQIDINNYITIEALEDNLTISVSITGRAYYGIDGIGWNEYERMSEILLNRGQTISFKGTNVKAQFYIDKPCNILGNGYSLLVGDDAVNITDISAFGNEFLLFPNCPIINVASNFLPATTLSYRCYSGMFYGCTSLTVAPELPATTLVYECYSGMFENCTNLNYIKMLAIDISVKQCLYDWVNGVSSIGTFVKNKNAIWDVRGVNGIPEGWTVIDDTFPTNEDGMPESTTFEFPLYFNTQIMEQTDDFLYRERLGDTIVEAYLRFIKENANGTEWNIPESFLNDYPVYIDGYRMISGSYLFGNIENIVTAKDYGNYNELYIYIGPEEFCVEGYN